jgi:hypothetical protein
VRFFVYRRVPEEMQQRHKNLAIEFGDQPEHVKAKAKERARDVGQESGKKIAHLAVTFAREQSATFYRVGSRWLPALFSVAMLFEFTVKHGNQGLTFSRWLDTSFAHDIGCG